MTRKLAASELPLATGAVRAAAAAAAAAAPEDKDEEAVENVMP